MPDQLVPHSYTVEFHDTPQLWVAYNGCGCPDCPKGVGKTQEEAVADLEEQTHGDR